MKFIEGEPRKPATKRVFGRSNRSSGAPSCSITPSLSRTILISEGHGFDLIMGDVDHGLAKLLVEPLDLGAHLVPELGIQVGKRLVEQEETRIPDDRPADRDALALAAGKLSRQAFQERRNVQHLRRVSHATLDLGPRQTFRALSPKAMLSKTFI